MLLQKEQLESHEQQLNKLENTIVEHKKGPIPSKGLALQNYKEKELFLQYEVNNINNNFNAFSVPAISISLKK